MEMDRKLEKIGKAFRIEGDYLGYEKIKVGNVNQTYKVTYRQPDGSPKSYIVQRVNTYAFRQPEELMHTRTSSRSISAPRSRRGWRCIFTTRKNAKLSSTMRRAASGA